jgi:hypothetical protein
MRERKAHRPSSFARARSRIIRDSFAKIFIDCRFHFRKLLTPAHGTFFGPLPVS